VSWILPHEYFGLWMNHPDVTAEVRTNADVLLGAVNDLMDIAFETSIDFKLNPVTTTYVSGQQYGGFRPQDCCQGAPLSSHKRGQAVDVYDKDIGFADWCLKNQDKLQARGLYMEHPDSTPTWCHLTTRPPKSGKRVFMP
jgi:hypothetical protein